MAAFAMAIRRLQGRLGGLDGARGLAVIMRYTLRLLTLQQFQRPTTLLCAMEVDPSRGDDKMGQGAVHARTMGRQQGHAGHDRSSLTRPSRRSATRIGTVQASLRRRSSPAARGAARDLRPGRDIEVDTDRRPNVSSTAATNSDVANSRRRDQAASLIPDCPVKVVDEEIYRRPPTMMIATVDKFAMMAWRAEVRNAVRAGRSRSASVTVCYGPGTTAAPGTEREAHIRREGEAGPRFRPPDLIIQDEFHLISGPLGTMVGLYETAVDELCTWHARRR